MTRDSTFVLIMGAHGRTSEYVTRDIGPKPPFWWHCWHDAWRIGAMSFENVGTPEGMAAEADSRACDWACANGTKATSKRIQRPTADADRRLVEFGSSIPI